MAALGGAGIALAIYIAVVRSIGRSQASAIIAKAEAEAESIKQQKILQSK